MFGGFLSVACLMEQVKRQVEGIGSLSSQPHSPLPRDSSAVIQKNRINSGKNLHYAPYSSFAPDDDGRGEGAGLSSVYSPFSSIYVTTGEGSRYLTDNPLFKNRRTFVDETSF